ncbi:unnamed protein product [Closterium sp. NIES-53]
MALLRESWSLLIINLNHDLPRLSLEDVKRAILHEDFRRCELASADGAGAASIGQGYGRGRGRGRGEDRFVSNNFNGSCGSGSYGSDNKSYGCGSGRFDGECHYCTRADIYGAIASSSLMDGTLLKAKRVEEQEEGEEEAVEGMAVAEVPVAPRPRPNRPQAPHAASFVLLLLLLLLRAAATTAATAAAACPASPRSACCATMALLRVLAFDHEGRPIQFDTWLHDLQLYLLSDSKDSVSLFDLASGTATAPPATGDSATRSQWLTRDVAARLAIRNHLPLVERAHFIQHRRAQALYDAVVARYSSPATAALGRLLLPYLFPELSAFATVEDLVSHLRTSDARYCATVPAEFLDRNQPLMFINLYIIVTRLLDSLRSVRDHFLTAVAVGAARGTPHTPFFEGCSPSPLAPSYASVAAANVPGAEDVRAASASAKSRSSKGKGGRSGGGGSGGGGGGSSGGGGGSGVLPFDAEGRHVAFDTWHDDLQLYLLSDSRDSVSLFDQVSGAAPAPPATADVLTRSQWLSHDATARLAIRNHLPATECAHFGEHRTAQALYDAVVARYSSPAIAALGRLLLPYLFPELLAFATVADLVTQLRTSDARYRATVPAEFLSTNQPPMFITLYFIVTRLPDSLCSVRDHFLTLDPTSLTIDLLEQHLLAAETSAVPVGAARGTLRSPFFEGCSPSPLSSSFASAATADVSVPEDVGAASTSMKRRNSKGKGGQESGGGSGGGGGGSGRGSEGSGRGGGCGGGGGGGGTGGGGGGSGGRGGGSGGSGGSGGGGTSGGRSRPQRGGPGGGRGQQQQPRSETQTPQQLREWLVQRGAGEGSETCPYVIRTGARAGRTCGRFHTERRCFAHLDDAWRTEFGDDVERPRWAELLRLGVAIFDLDFDVMISAIYAFSSSAEGDCYWCVPPDPGIAAASLGASASSTPPGTAPSEALHTFTLDSGASCCFFCDSTTLTPLPAPVPVRLADPFEGLVVANSSTVLPSPAVPSGLLSGLHLPSFSTNLVSTAALQDAMVTTTTPGGQRVSIFTCTRTGRHLATFTRRPGSSLYTLATEPPQVAASAQVSASGQVAASCSCCLLSHQTLIWHHRLGHPSLPHLRGMHSRLLVSGLPRSLPPLPPSPASPCLPCVEGRQRAASHSSSFPPTTAPLQTLHMDVWGPSRVSGQGRECYFLLIVDDCTRYTTVFPLRSKGEVSAVLIPWIRTVRLQLRERFGQDLPVLRLHFERGGEFSSDLLRDFCRGDGIL